MFTKRHVMLFSAATGTLLPFQIARAQRHSASETAMAALHAQVPDSQRTTILVLATPHLSALGPDLDRSALGPLLDVLARFRPDIIGVEMMPPTTIEAMTHDTRVYGSSLKVFVGAALESGLTAQRALGLSRYEAARRADSVAAAIRSSESTTFARRRQLAMTFLAAFDLHSAILQWSYLPDSASRSEPDTPTDLAEYLTRESESRNERVSVGVALARRLGLQKVDGIDDQQQNDIVEAISPQLGKELQTHPLYEQTIKSPVYVESNRRLHAAAANGNLLPYYEYLNSGEYMSADLAAQWALFYRMHLPSGVDRANAAAWEIRNLNIASNVRRLSARAAGKRVLIIIGASHKAFLDAYLSQLIDVRVTDLSDLTNVDPKHGS